MTGCQGHPKLSPPSIKMPSSTRNFCRKDCCRLGRDPNTIPLAIRLKNNTIVGLTGPARYELHRATKRGLPGINLDRTDIYQPICFAAKREWQSDVDGWQTVHHNVRKVKSKSKSKSKSISYGNYGMSKEEDDLYEARGGLTEVEYWDRYESNYTR